MLQLGVDVDGFGRMPQLVLHYAFIEPDGVPVIVWSPVASAVQIGLLGSPVVRRGEVVHLVDVAAGHHQRVAQLFVYLKGLGVAHQRVDAQHGAVVHGAFDEIGIGLKEGRVRYIERRSRHLHVTVHVVVFATLCRQAGEAQVGHHLAVSAAVLFGVGQHLARVGFGNLVTRKHHTFAALAKHVVVYPVVWFPLSASLEYANRQRQ